MSKMATPAIQHLNLPQPLSLNFSTGSTDVVPFYGHAKNHNTHLPFPDRVFSNLFPSKLLMPEGEFESVEHYFQMYKYSEGDRLFMKGLSTGEVAKYGQRRLKLSPKHITAMQSLQRHGKPCPKKRDGSDYAAHDTAEPVLLHDDWDTIKIGVMYRALVVKFTQNPDLKANLLATGSAWLVEHTKNDKQWADGLTGQGTNFLGKLLMYVRHGLKVGELIDPNDTSHIDLEFIRTPMDRLLTYS